MSLSQCPAEYGSCQPALGGGLVWLMKRTHVGLGEGTGPTHCGSRLREKVTWAETRSLFPSEPCCWPREEMVWKWVSSWLFGDAWFMSQNRLSRLGQLLLPPSSPPEQAVISVRCSLFAAQVPSFALHGDFWWGFPE